MTVTTNVLNCQNTVKRLINTEIALNVVKATNLLMVSVKLMIIVKNTDGSVLIRNGHILGLKAANKFVNVVKRVMNFVKENVFLYQIKNTNIEVEEP